MIKVLHIIHALSLGGAARGMIATAKYSAQQAGFQHRVVSLTPAHAAATQLAQEAGMGVVSAPDRATLEREMAWADIVHISWWNDPELYDFLTSELPSMRLMIWPHVAGDGAPQIITEQLVDFADLVVASSPYTFDRSVFRNMPEQERLGKVAMVYDAADFARVADVQPKPHSTFNVGYIGTVDFVKMHPRFVPMSAAVDIPNVQFVVCGGGIEHELRLEAQRLGADQRFDFRGYVSDIRPVLEVLDVYGYPLCEGNYASAELNLQEVMVTGIPPVVFPYGGVGRLVINDFTGLIVHSEQEYRQAIEYLFHHPEERARLGRNAQEYARQLFGAENAARRLNPVYERMMKTPKRERAWGAKAGIPLLDQAVSLEDLRDTPASGAERFIESLGSHGEDFRVSLTSSTTSELLAAERRIATAGPLLRSEWSGGIVHYRNHYPENAQLRLWSGLTKLEQGDFDAALVEFAKAKELGFAHWRLDWYRAQTAHRAGKLAVAEHVLVQVVRAAPEFLEASLMLADLWMAESRYEESISLLEASLQAHPDAPEALKRLGISRHAVGDNAGAERALRLALDKAPQDPDLLFSLGDLSLGAGDAAKALQYFKATTELTPLDAEAWLGTATAALQLSDRATFLHALRETEKLAPDHPQLRLLAQQEHASFAEKR